jgi:Transcriptional regulators
MTKVNNSNANALRQSRTPLYLQMAEVLRQRVHRGVWAPGDLLPTLDELAREFSVAKVTVRQAVKLLQDEGLLASRRGHGTTVLHGQVPIRQLSVATRLSSLVEMYRGDIPDLTLLEDRTAEIPGTPFVGRVSDHGYHMLRRTHARDGLTYCMISLYFDRPLFNRYETQFRKELALPVLQDSNVAIGRARQTLTVGKCDVETAGLLNLTVGDPVAEVRRILCDPDDKIVYLADVTYRGDFIKLEMDLLA